MLTNAEDWLALSSGKALKGSLLDTTPPEHDHRRSGKEV
jgi:hypothetical protein